MKRNIWILMAGALLLTGCAKQSASSAASEQKDDEQKEQEQESVPETPAKELLLVKEEYSDATQTYTKEYTYDEEGNVLTETYNSSAEGYSRSENTYANGKIVHSDVESTGGFIEGNYTSDYFYNEDGSYTMTNVYENGSIREEYAYDQWGNLLKLTSGYDGGEYVQENETEVDGEGRPVHVTTKANGEVMNEVFYEYDDNGAVVYTKTVSNAGPGIGQIMHEIRYEYTYDENENLAKRVQYEPSDPDNTRIITDYTYNEYGQCVTETTVDPAGNRSELVRTYQ